MLLAWSENILWIFQTHNSSTFNIHNLNGHENRNLVRDTSLSEFSVCRIAVFALSRDFKINMPYEVGKCSRATHFGER